jgi:serine/threonine protein kinase
MSPPVQPGQIIRGKYRIDRVLGEGGMGIVVAGQHVGLGQRVAIKFLHGAMLQHREIVERFAREARAASRLESDHVARVTDVDALEDGTPFMVMEYLEGSDLSTVRASGQPLPMNVAVGYILQACEAIGEAHELGIVHRDIKPANLFLAKRAGGKTRVKVLDFGISKMGGGGDAGLTSTSAVVGSAHYMSPEQMLATRDVDARTDIWALGATLYELVTARVPFPGESVTQVAAMVMSSTPEPPSRHRPELPPALDHVIMRCLERDLARRIGTIGELVAALTPLLQGQPGPSAAHPAPIGTPPTGPGYPPAPHSLGASGSGASSSGAPNDGSTVMLPEASSSHRHSSPGAAAQGAWPAQVPLGAPPAAPSFGSGPGGAASPSGAGPSDPGVVGGRPWPSASSTASPVTSGPQPASSSRTVTVLGGIGVVATIALGATVFILRGDAPTTPATASAAITPDARASAAPRNAGDAADVLPSAGTLEVTPAAAASPAVASPSGAPSASAAPRATAHATSQPANPKPLSTSTPVKKPAVSCSPPFTIDAQGVKRAKPECM